MNSVKNFQKSLSPEEKAGFNSRIFELTAGDGTPCFWHAESEAHLSHSSRGPGEVI